MDELAASPSTTGDQSIVPQPRWFDVGEGFANLVVSPDDVDHLRKLNGRQAPEGGRLVVHLEPASADVSTEILRSLQRAQPADKKNLNQTQEREMAARVWARSFGLAELFIFNSHRLSPADLDEILRVVEPEVSVWLSCSTRMAKKLELTLRWAGWKYSRADPDREPGAAVAKHVQKRRPTNRLRPVSMSLKASPTQQRDVGAKRRREASLVESAQSKASRYFARHALDDSDVEPHGFAGWLDFAVTDSTGQRCEFREFGLTAFLAARGKFVARPDSGIREKPPAAKVNVGFLSSRSPQIHAVNALAAAGFPDDWIVSLDPDQIGSDQHGVRVSGFEFQGDDAKALSACKASYQESNVIDTCVFDQGLLERIGLPAKRGTRRKSSSVPVLGDLPEVVAVEGSGFGDIGRTGDDSPPEAVETAVLCHMLGREFNGDTFTVAHRRKLTDRAQDGLDRLITQERVIDIGDRLNVGRDVRRIFNRAPTPLARHSA